ncbi:MAG TPA: MotB family protein [Methylovirgula sp.]|nr:MotB family protein [Methylovirgula sp.]
MSDSDKKPELLIIKRVRGESSHHHGGAWKIAFADFMTAMMALFLVLWLINATNPKTKAALARYFNPVNLVDMSTTQRGVHDPQDSSESNGKGNGKALNPGDEEGPKPNDFPPVVQSPDPNSAERPPTYSEAALFRDPYAVLAEIAAADGAGKPVSNSDQGMGDAGGSDDDTYKDPFKPVPANASNVPAPPNALLPAPQATKTAPIPAAASGPKTQTPAGDKLALADKASPAKIDAKLSEAPANSAAAKANETSPPAKPQSSSADMEASKVKAEIANLVGQAAKGQAAPNIEVKATEEGILIRLTDKANFAMFAIGSAEPQPKTVRIMDKIAQVLRKEKGAIIVSGHTDGRQYKSATYDNWRLSTARAQMAYYMLVRGGVDEKRIERVEGYADRKLKVPNNPLADENRRIEIFLRKGE